MPGNPIIEVHHLYKLYRLGTISSGTLKRDLSRWWDVNVLKKDDPSLKVDAGAAGNHLLWALHDVSFNVQEGEVLGVIGKNGAGKSTILKILSRITRPTKGYAKGRGRIASLLEVGTGFHDELTGRENIYLNGNILGMTKKQIDKKLEEIIDFSGVDEYIDTPVKRYSSGMYVRLAFSVAAHMEPDILIVDEALSVGDTEFQKKCMNKIREVSSKDGKTIIFVSHSMQAIQSFCHRVILLEKGRIINDGTPEKIIHEYLHSLQKTKVGQIFADPSNAPGNDLIRIRTVYLEPELDNPSHSIDVQTTIRIKFECWSLVNELNISVGMYLFTAAGECIFNALSSSIKAGRELIEGCCTIPGNLLTDGSYVVSFAFLKDTHEDFFYHEECLSFDVTEHPNHLKWYGKWSGYVRPRLDFTLRPKSVVNAS